ncbi:sensor histidine kinase [Anaeromicropila populeti]|nr:histidine kinase N-terminal 7TM domain-containing protein [Anaeromicropila populeti]
MEISHKLAIEIYTILTFHIAAIILLTGFTTFIYLKSKRTPLLYSYLSVVAMILLWMISKVLKTVSPNQTVRWFFIITQYFGVQFLGLFLLIFSLIYINNRIPGKTLIFFLSVPPVVSYIIVLTNPIHMQFYSYYDFYRDKFGKLFVPIQSIQYIYLIVSILLLSRNFTHQQSLKNKKIISFLLSTVIIFTLLCNGYYILFKLTSIPWIFPFPVFDFTPVFGALTLILFTIPAYRYRFLDLLPVSYQLIYDNIPQGIGYLNSSGNLLYCNRTFSSYFETDMLPPYIFCKNFCSKTITYCLNNIYYKITKIPASSSDYIIIFHDISEILKLNQELQTKNEELELINAQLQKLAETVKELAITKTKADIAQRMHDILGHTFTVAIGNCGLIARENQVENCIPMVQQIRELLESSLSDINKSLSGKDFTITHTSLTKAIDSLKNQNILVDFVTQGTMYELNTRQTEAIFRLCQEAVTNSIRHSNSSLIHIILRYKPAEIEIYVIDDGSGCKEIRKGYGLHGIEDRIKKLSGSVIFGSDGTKGFHIHATIPK